MEPTQQVCGLMGLTFGAEQAKDGGARAGHAGQHAPLRLRQFLDQQPDLGHELHRGGLQVVARFAEPQA
ncbi:hypothetical protein D3C86_2254610 [compost metagenome]